MLDAVSAVLQLLFTYLWNSEYIFNYIIIGVSKVSSRSLSIIEFIGVENVNLGRIFIYGY